MKNRYGRLMGVLWLSILLLGGTPVRIWAHAFPDHSEPRVGSAVKLSPGVVRIWFDSELESVFSSIRVMNENHQMVDKGDGRVDERNRTLLEVSLSVLPPGRYHVVWVAVSVDGHRTEGDFSFRVEGPP